MAYEDDIKAELARSWVGRSRRKWLEAELAKVQGASVGASIPIRSEPPAQAVGQPTQQPRTAAPMAPSTEIVIEGSPAFIAATEAALRSLQGTPSWVLASKLRGIRQIEQSKLGGEVGGYLQDGIFHAGDSVWRSDVKQYASGIVHEGAHAANPRVSGTEGEKMAFKAQVQSLKELGASGGIIAHYQRQADNPTHHLNWRGPRH